MALKNLNLVTFLTIFNDGAIPGQNSANPTPDRFPGGTARNLDLPARFPDSRGKGTQKYLKRNIFHDLSGKDFPEFSAENPSSPKNSEDVPFLLGGPRKYVLTLLD